jgi:myosin heavy subunit
MSKDRSYSSSSSGSDIDPANSLESCEDLITLSEVNEEIILNVIKARFAVKSIYTAIGTVLLVVNPFQKIPGIIGQDVITRYFEHSSVVGGKAAATSSAPSLPAHVYQIPSRAYG